MLRGIGPAELTVEAFGTRWSDDDAEAAVGEAIRLASSSPGRRQRVKSGGLVLELCWSPLALDGQTVAQWKDVLRDLLAALPGAYREIRDRPNKQNRGLTKVEAKLGELMAACEEAGLSPGEQDPLTVERFLEGDRAVAVRRYTPDDLKSLFKREAGHEFHDIEQMREFSIRTNLILKPAGVWIKVAGIGEGVLAVNGPGKRQSFKLRTSGTTLGVGARVRCLPSNLSITPR